MPRLPACYEFIKGQDPKAAIIDVPQSYSGSSTDINGVCTYWQSLHRCPTTAGYSGVPNAAYDMNVLEQSPFAVARLADPGYLASARAGASRPTDFREHVRKYLASHRIRYIVVHTEGRLLLNQSGEKLVDTAVLERVRSQLDSAKVFEDEMATVYDQVRLERPNLP